MSVPFVTVELDGGRIEPGDRIKRYGSPPWDGERKTDDKINMFMRQRHRADRSVRISLRIVQLTANA